VRYSEEFIEKVRAANNIEDIISGYVKLQRKGSSYMGLCPFHNEKTPSFSVHPGRQTYHCFGCGASGDVFNFIMEYDRMSFQEAIVSLANRAGIAVPENDVTEEQKKAASEKIRLLNIQKDAAMFYYYKLHSQEGKVAVKYLTDRGLSAETIKHFGLGYTGKSGSGLYAYLKKKGHSDRDLKESGLFTFNEAKNTMQEKFWNRVMFPIMDINRKVIGFGGRVFGDAKPKYLNSPETKLFDKSRNLYGLHIARSSREKYMIICEGYMDVITLHQAGFTNAVASLGTALTSQQAALLHRYTKDICLMYDSDEAGVKAALRAVPLLRSAGLNAKIVDLKPYKDPDEFIKAKGSEGLAERIKKAENGFMFEIRILYESYDMSDPQAVSDFYHEAARKLLTFSDEIERNSYASSVSRMYNIAPEVLKRQLGKLAMQGIRSEETPQMAERPGKKKDKTYDRAEKILLSWICQKPETIEMVREYIGSEDFSEGLNRIMADNLFKMYEEKRFNPVAVLNLFEETNEKSDAAAIIEGSLIPEREEDFNKAIKEVMLSVKSASLERKIENLPVSDMAAFQKVMAEKKNLEEMRKLIGG
jgi:DNA primase